MACEKPSLPSSPSSPSHRRGEGGVPSASPCPCARLRANTDRAKNITYMEYLSMNDNLNGTSLAAPQIDLDDDKYDLGATETFLRMAKHKRRACACAFLCSTMGSHAC